LPEGVWWAALLGHVVLMAKVVFFCVLQIVIRWTLPRFRYDHLMNLGWKMLLPLSLVNLIGTAVVKVAL
jgi:NADH-quinone oxidoreductase subunit H